MTFNVGRTAADHVILSAGWRRRLIAFVAGACGALAMAPLNIVPAIAIPLTIAVWLIDGAAGAGAGPKSRGALFRGDVKAAFGAGWWLGFGYFVAGLWWVAAAMLVDADQFAWAAPLASLGLPAALAFFPALGFALARALWSPGAARVLALGAGLGASEWLRGIVATGFPWNDFGMALGGNLVLAQIASLVGLHGLTVLAIVIFAAPSVLIDAPGARRRFWGLGALPVGCAAALAGLAMFGALRLSAGHVGEVEGVRLRIMQPNIPEGPAFRPENKTAILDHYLALSDRATSPETTGVADVTHLIWPESAFPFILSRDAEALGRITGFLGSKTILITGAARYDETGEPGRLGARRAYFNSIQALDHEHGFLASYDKIHLVPFGEYLPFDWLLEKLKLRQLVHVPGGFSPGGPRKNMSIPGLPAVSGLVCYEAVFSGEVTLHGGPDERPGLLLNVSDDGWYGATPGPYQHFSQARLRAIEEGLPLVRSASTGISGVIDPYGRVTASLPLGVEGVLDARLPKPIAATIFARWPLAGPLLLLLAALLAALAGRWRAG